MIAAATIAPMLAKVLRRRVGLSAGAIALAAVSGCSFLFVEAPPHDHASRQFFDCTSSMLAPGIDAVLTGLGALGVAGNASDGAHDSQQVIEGAALVATTLASATYGYIRVSHCRDAKEALQTRLINVPFYGAPPWDPTRAPPPAGAWQPMLPPGVSTRPTAPGPGDRWLSEGPPPPPPMAMPPAPAPWPAAPAPAPAAPAPAPGDAGAHQ